MRNWVCAAAAAFVLALAPSAGAELADAGTFVSAYAPRAGDRAEIIVEKCRSATRDGERTETCGRSVYLEEMLSVLPQGGGRMRYTLQSLTPTGQGASPIPPEMENALQNFSMLLTVDASGFPTRLENMDEMLGHVRNLVGVDDANRERAFEVMFARMDEAGAAQLFTRDWAGVSLFQGIEAEVGKPVRGQIAMPFPVDPSLSIDATATLLVESIDQEAQRANISYTQIVDEESARPVITAFVQRMLAATTGDQSEEVARTLASMRMRRSDEWRAVVDIPSGRVVEMRSRAETYIAVAGEVRETSETINLVRRMLPPY